MSEPALKILPVERLDQLKAAVETEWKLLGQALLAGQQAGVRAEMHRQELGFARIKLRNAVLDELPKPASTGGRPKSAWWIWFEEWQPPNARGSISRDEAKVALRIAGDKDPDEAEETFRARKRKSKAKSKAKRAKTFGGYPASVSPESPAPVISLAVRRIQGMIRKLSAEDREALLDWMKETYS